MVSNINPRPYTKEAALAGVLKSLVAKFCANWPKWQKAAEATAALDALCSLAVASEEMAAAAPHSCTPTVHPAPQPNNNNNNNNNNTDGKATSNRIITGEIYQQTIDIIMVI